MTKRPIYGSKLIVTARSPNAGGPLCPDSSLTQPEDTQYQMNPGQEIQAPNGRIWKILDVYASLIKPEKVIFKIQSKGNTKHKKKTFITAYTLSKYKIVKKEESK